jgi:hypothetical protein
VKWSPACEEINLEQPNVHFCKMLPSSAVETVVEVTEHAYTNFSLERVHTYIVRWRSKCVSIGTYYVKVK